MTTKRYKLPAELGGGEFDAWIVTSEHALFEIADGEVSIMLKLLTEVPPPAPPAPEPGPYLIGTAYVILTFAEYDGRTYAHQPGERGALEWSYWWSKFGDGLTVENIRRLVPESDPLPEVTLPWTGEEHQGDGLRVERYDATSVSVAILGRATSWMTLGTARELAAALIAAASTQDGAW